MANRYAVHQALVKSATLALQNEWPSRVRIFDRHVGRFVPLSFFKMLKKKKVTIWDYVKFIVSINKKGMTDNIIHFKTDWILVCIDAEAKTGKAVQTDEQIIWQEYIESMNGCYILYHTDQELIDGVRNFLESKKLL